ncbi:hypothetical protein [Aeromonas phage AS-yj]|uniref:Uncharacterized protein n=1 Tax=Aeromonas phage AS-yj TaxID=2026115 RepID=A0A291LEZ8_9CAUD|nr:hypothetical protein [Aeromonas phage AS-yj]
MIQIRYQASNYSPELVTGRYVREDFDGGYLVVEAATNFVKGPFYGKLGHGPTLREYITDGSEIPQHVKDEAKKLVFRMTFWEI